MHFSYPITNVDGCTTIAITTYEFKSDLKLTFSSGDGTKAEKVLDQQVYTGRELKVFVRKFRLDIAKNTRYKEVKQIGEHFRN